jgi:membrane protease YdiL (CAAX protease family)
MVSVGGFFLAQFLGALILAFYAEGSNTTVKTVVETISDKPLLSMLLSLIIYGLYLLIIWSFMNYRRISFKDIGMKLPKEKWDVLLYTLAGFGIYFVATLIAGVIMNNVLSEKVLDRQQDVSYSTATSGKELIFVFIGLVILPPLIEEIAMRGFLFTGLRKTLNFVWTGLIVAVIFAAAHLGFGSGDGLLWTVAVDTFILSWVLVYVREKTGSLYPAIGIHMIKNFVAFMALFIFKVA